MKYPYKLLVFISLVSFLLFTGSCVKDNASQIPTCRITSPSNGQEFVKGETITVSVDTDDISSNILEVRIFIDGIGKSAITSFPYNYEWNTSGYYLGDHTIKASSIDYSGEVNSDEISITLIDGTVSKEKPVASFVTNMISGTAPLSVNFTDESLNFPSSWKWKFGDGATSTEQNPTHVYNLEGIYTVTLIVSNSFGTDTLIRQDYIYVGESGGGAPCPGTPTVTDADGNTYNTVMLGSQCWMRENLRVGTRVNGSKLMQNDGIIEKYCYDDNPANCEIYGGLYQWSEMMQYTTQEGAQGICPTGWHIPSDQEWKYMEMHLGMSQAEADLDDWRGTNQGDMIKTTTGWDLDGNGTNSSGFSGKPSGFRSSENFDFEGLGIGAFWWTSTQFDDNHTWYRHVGPYVPQINRTHNYNGSGISVRCVKD